jgi:hypothetical protein
VPQEGDFKVIRFQVLKAASMKMSVFWVVAPCSLAEVYRRFRISCYLHHQGALDFKVIQEVSAILSITVFRTTALFGISVCAWRGANRFSEQVLLIHMLALQYNSSVGLIAIEL